ncbi:MAG: serine--tRNA ligase [Bacteroidales bacterium]
MLQIQYLRNNKKEIVDRLSIKGFTNDAIIDDILKLDKERRKTQSELDEILAESRRLAKTIGQLMQQGKKPEAEAVKEKTTSLKKKAKTLQHRLSDQNHRQQQLLMEVPNVPHTSVPAGNTEQDNLLIKTSENIPEIGSGMLPHWELAKKFDLIDFDLGVKITGAGFPVYKDKVARLQRAMQAFFLDAAAQQGYQEIQPPLLVNEASAFGTGQLPDKDGQMYNVKNDDYFLIPTSEVPVTNLYRDMIMDEQALPVKNSAFSACFRREAGSYGKDVRGLNRLHQFDKVEIVQIVHPEKSYEVIEEMVNYVVSLVEKLELPYRVLKLCGGDTSFAAALTYDVEVFSKGQNKWLEVSSVSNFESFQANRMKLRFKDKHGNKQLLHTLNGSALAFPRVLAAILENNQQGSKIKVPRVLVKYLGNEFIE